MGLAKVDKGILGGHEVDVCLCPRCDGWPALCREDDGDLWYWFKCPDCGFTPGLRMYGTSDEALRAWNSGAEAEARRLRQDGDGRDEGRKMIETGE